VIIRTAQPKSGRRLTVLVVEYEPLLAFDLLDELAVLGHEGVGPVMAGRDVMAVREERRIDLALVDINLLDGRTGIDVGRYLAVHGIPYAFLTASPEALPPDLAGAIAVVAKLCAAEELRLALKYLCDITLGDEGNNCPPLALLPQPAMAAPDPSRTLAGRAS